MSERLLLPADPSSVARARHWAASLARRVHAGPAAEHTVELLTSELLTNAVVHTGSRAPISVSARMHDDALHVAVTDTDTTLPVVRPTSPGRPGGNGMRIVDMLSSTWGVDVHPGVGKTVWFEASVGSRAGAALLSA
jgi:anti-sigma regulatory factor (Ser/Thr protein kinase)